MRLDENEIRRATFNATCEGCAFIQRLHFGVVDSLVIDPLSIHAKHQSHSPARRIIGIVLIALGPLLNFQQCFAHCAIWLIHTHDNAANRELVFVQSKLFCKLMHLYLVRLQHSNQAICSYGILLLQRNNPGIWRFVIAGYDSVFTLGPEVFQDLVGMVSGEFERNQNTALHKVVVVTQAPLDFRGWGYGAVPLPRCPPGARVSTGADFPLVCVGTGITERLVETADGVVGVGHPEKVAGVPAGIETPGPDAGHSVTGQLRYFVEREPLPFGNRDRIDGGVIGAGAD